jgi:hypothetical protein
MSKILRHSLSLLVASFCSGLLFTRLEELVRGEWTVRNGGWLYDPWYEGLFLEVICTLFICDLLRQAILGRLMPVRLTLECILVCVAFTNLRIYYFPLYAIFLVLIGCCLALIASVGAEIRALASLDQLSQKKEPPNQSSQPTSPTRRG